MKAIKWGSYLTVKYLYSRDFEAKPVKSLTRIDALMTVLSTLKKTSEEKPRTLKRSNEATLINVLKHTEQTYNVVIPLVKNQID